MTGPFKRAFYRSYHRSAGLKHRLQRLLTPAGWLALVSLLACGGIGVDTSQAMAYQAVALLGAAFLVAAASHFRRKPRFEFSRDLPKYGSVGTPFLYRARLFNRGGKTLRGLSILDAAGDPRPSLDQFLQTPEPNETGRNAMDRFFGYYRWAWLVQRNRRAEFKEEELAPLPACSATETNLKVLPMRRGRLEFERAEISDRDPFGLSRHVLSLRCRQSITILPKRYAVPALALPGRLEYQRGGVALAGSVGEAEEIVALRDYRRGDPLRHVHWRSSARTGRLVVKEFEDEFFVRHAMILDTFQTAESPEVFEEAVCVAASFACTVQTQESLLDLLFVGTKTYCCTVGRGVGRTEQLLEILACVEPCRDKNISVLEPFVLSHLSQVSGAICIFLNWDASRQELVRKMQARGVPVLVLVIADPGNRTDPGSMLKRPGQFHVLETGNIAEGLSRLAV